VERFDVDFGNGIKVNLSQRAASELQRPAVRSPQSAAPTPEDIIRKGGLILSEALTELEFIESSFSSLSSD
jgi:hypothetical protein